MKPKLLDLYCCEGGSGTGYHRAGFDVYGVDKDKQPRYPFAFRRDDALDVMWSLLAGEPVEFTHPDGRKESLRRDDFAVITGSPPCQHYSITKHSHKNKHPDLVPPTRAAMVASRKPWVMENVPGAPMPGALVLCGSEFNLKTFDPATGRDIWLKRHRLFESNVFLWGAGGCSCHGRFIGGVYGGGSSDNNHAKQVRRGGYTPAKQVRGELLGCDWMTMHGQAQAIPPAYTHFIGLQLIEHLAERAA